MLCYIPDANIADARKFPRWEWGWTLGFGWNIQRTRCGKGAVAAAVARISNLRVDSWDIFLIRFRHIFEVFSPNWNPSHLHSSSQMAVGPQTNIASGKKSWPKLLLNEGCQAPVLGKLKIFGKSCILFEIWAEYCQKVSHLGCQFFQMSTGRQKCHPRNPVARWDAHCRPTTIWLSDRNAKNPPSFPDDALCIYVT